MILRVVVFLFTGWVFNVNGYQYIYVNQSKTWEEAREYCRQKNFELSTLNGQGIEMCNLTEATELWTNNFIYTTPYLSLLGCYEHTYEMQFRSLQKASVVECQMLCRDSPRFAIRDNSCKCMQTDSNQCALQNAELCNYTCDEQAICGGENAISIYEQANISDLLNEQPLFPPNNSRCLVYQCVNGTVDYQEKDCENQELANDNDFFSCSFEPETDCFLWQSKDSDLKWSIQNSAPQNDPKLRYTASYYAYVHGPGAASKQTAVLISKIKFKASDWCLRFRYFGNTSASMDIIIWDLVANKTCSLVQIRNSTKQVNTNTAWYLMEQNVNMTNDFKLMFKFESAENETEISIDDVTMIADSCNKTVSTLLNKGRGIQCTFGGNFDVCFRQDESNDTTNWNLANNVRWLGIEEGEEAVLISKFELYDIMVNISIKFTSRKNLELYLKDEQGNKTYIIERNKYNSTSDITISKTISVNASSNLYIFGKTMKSNQEIRINFIKINVITKSNILVERVNSTFRIPDPYAMTILDIKNLRCIDGGGITMSNTIKVLGELLPQNGKPSAVNIYGKNHRYWETFDSTKSRPFVCEQDSGSDNTCETSSNLITPREGVQKPNVMWIAVILACLLVLIAICIASIIVYKRKQLSKNNHNTKDHSLGEPSSIKLAYEKVERTQNDNVEEDYDHLHQNQTNTHASSSENVYSHTTDNQYGLLPVITDDTYDHTVGREGEYGTTQVSQDSENTYDHT